MSKVLTVNRAVWYHYTGSPINEVISGLRHASFRTKSTRRACVSVGCKLRFLRNSYVLLALLLAPFEYFVETRKICHLHNLIEQILGRNKSSFELRVNHML